MNLHELDIPENADEAADWAARREFGLRYDSYRECLLREAAITPLQFICVKPEEQWVRDMGQQIEEDLMREAYPLDDPKHPDFHSVHADLWDNREGK